MCPYLDQGPPPQTPDSHSTPTGSRHVPPTPLAAGADNAPCQAYLEARIAQLEFYHNQLDEDDHIKDLELRVKELEISAHRRSSSSPSGKPAAREPAVGSLGRGPLGVLDNGSHAASLGKHRPADRCGSVGQPEFPAADQRESSPFTSDEHGRFKRSNSKFRPDFHMDLPKSLKKYTFREFVLGCMYEAEALVVDGRPIAGYLSHVRFISWKAAMSGAFLTQSLIKYDHHVSSKVIRGELPDWVLGEEEAVCLHLGVDGTVAYKQLAGGNKSSRSTSHGDFSDFPSDVCWLFNFRSCDSNFCKRKHVCHLCRGSHRGRACPSKTAGADQTGEPPKST